MRLQCDLQLSYYHIPNSKPTKARARLSLAKKTAQKQGRYSTDSSEAHYMVISSHTGSKLRDTRYKLDGNIMTVSKKFVSKGMTTIQFREPPHCLSISNGGSDEIQKLVRILEMIQLDEREFSDEFEPLSSMIPVKLKDIQPKPTSMSIYSRSKYPLTVLPQTLETFTVNNIGLFRFDERLAGLKNLRDLDLSHNKIKVLPTCINEMKLTSLILAHNLLQDLPDKFGTGVLAEHLKELNLSSNEISTLQLDFFGFSSLCNLDLSSNCLIEVHPNLKMFQKLKSLKLQSNKLQSLPISIFKLSLDFLDVTSNPFKVSGVKSDHGNVSLPPLFELAFRTLRSNYHIVERFKSVKSLPIVLLRKLDAGIQCPCGKFFYDTYLTFYSKRSLSNLKCPNLYLPNDQQVTLEIPLCAAKCIANVRQYQLYAY